ncbi:efflux RND transporter periplasmic adaptor subunit [Devosia beringensis]|uniref:efflux RND transporter periplasmic adaptor subunit n=1 Tax=Devosia beringensis TaxID=2657486 RepID=UPI00186B9B5B|nr:efflux RND transporter periplasmic adaptor subunit [Devosia beringensis]
MQQNAPDVAAVLAAENQRSAQRRRVTLIALVAVVLAAGGGWWWWTAGAATRSAQTYLTEAAAPADISVIVVATGTLEPTGEADVSSTLAGTIATVHVDANDKVSKGQVLARLAMGDLDARLAGAIAMVSSQEANLLVADTNRADAEAVLTRTQALSSGQSVSVRELELAASAAKRAQAQHAVAEAQLRAARADLQAVRNDYDKACICAPIDGVVLEANVNPGQAIITSAGLGQALFVLAEDLHRLSLEVDIDEADIGSVQQGDTASFAVETWPDRVFAGTIRKILFAPNIVDGVVSYRAELDVDNADMLLRPGMTATADIVVDNLDDVLSIPNAALRFSPEVAAGGSLMGGMMPTSSVVSQSGERSVWLLRDGAPVEVKVTVGLTDGQRSAVSGDAIKAGDQVVVGTVAR